MAHIPKPDERTPLPWKWWTSNSHNRLTSATGVDGDVIYAFRASHGHLCVHVTTQNMAFIERACNSYGDLLEACGAAEGMLEEMLKYIQSNLHDREYRMPALEKVRAALKKARGE
jgi:hypothetical protein